MSERVVDPGSFRRRLALAFVVILGLATAGLHLAAFSLIRESLLSGALERTLPQAEFAVDLTADHFTGPDADEDIDEVISEFESRSRFQAILVEEHARPHPSNEIGPDQIPESLIAVVRDPEADDGLASTRTDVDGTSHLVFGTVVPGTSLELYLFFAQQRVTENIEDIRRILFASWAVVLLVSALVGSLLARRVLQPIAKASDAARSLAEGLLDTRLPVEGSDEFGVWAESFNQMADALQAKIDALREARDRERRFTADVSHELRTPLTALMGAASVLQDELDSLPPDARRPAELLIGDVRRLRILVDDLMEVSRLDAGQVPIALEGVDAVEMTRSVLRARGWDERVRIVGPAARISTDPRRFERIVANLVENALEHGGDPVEVTVGTSADAVTIEVEDRGQGIAPKDLPHVFDRFYKADPARATQGSGLGLAIALENARLLGGDIEVSSSPGKGTCFRVVLPRDASVTGT